MLVTVFGVDPTQLELHRRPDANQRPENMYRIKSSQVMVLLVSLILHFGASIPATPPGSLSINQPSLLSNTTSIDLDRLTRIAK